jgi:hypothetical protein
MGYLQLSLFDEARCTDTGGSYLSVQGAEVEIITHKLNELLTFAFFFSIQFTIA